MTCLAKQSRCQATLLSSGCPVNRAMPRAQTVIKATTAPQARARLTFLSEAEQTVIQQV